MKSKTLQKIFALSGNQCAFPGCAERIHSDIKKFGEIAHIRAKKKGGPRWNPGYPDPDVYENLIAVCNSHGRYIDDPQKAEAYTVEVLTQYKKDHEDNVSKNSDRGWVSVPNSISGGDLGDKTLHYWIDRTSAPRIYSAEQLAICGVVMQLLMDLAEISKTFEVLRSNGDSPAKTIMAQSYARIGEASDSMVTHFYLLMAAAPHVTFEEFLRFGTTDGNIEGLIDEGAKRLGRLIEGEERGFFSITNQMRPDLDSSRS